MAIKVVPKDEMVKSIGTKFDPGPWITVDQQRINTFADCTVRVRKLPTLHARRTIAF